MRTRNVCAGIVEMSLSNLSGMRSLAGSMEKLLDSMVIVARRGASRNVRMYTHLLSPSMVIIIILLFIHGLTTKNIISCGVSISPNN